MSALKLGKRPATYDPRDLRYAAFRSTLPVPTPPAVFGHGNDFVGEGWLMLGNGPDDTVHPGFEGCGDCAWAGPAHETMELCQNAGRPVPKFTGKSVVEEYSAYCGYDPETGANDEGSDVRDVLSWRRKKGIKDAAGQTHKIGVYVALEPGNLQDILEACWLFEAVGIGFEVPDSAMEQFADGKPWSVAHGSQIDGGHYVPIVGRPQAGYLACVTWARRQLMTEAFFKKFCDEAWCYVSGEAINAKTGKSYEHFGAAELEEYLRAVAG